MKTKLFILTIFFSVSFMEKIIYAQSSSWIWSQSIGGTSFDSGNSVIIDASGNVYTTGYFGGTVDFDPGVGVFNLTSTGTNGFFISKLDAAGNFLWARAMTGTGGGYPGSIALDNSGNIYTTGYFNGTIDFDPDVIGIYNLSAIGSSNDIYISKIDALGNFLWAKSIGGSDYDYGVDIDIDPSGNVYTTGGFGNTVDFDPGLAILNLTCAGSMPFDIFISKLDSLGNFIWAKSMGGTNSDVAFSLALDNFGNVYTTGYFSFIADFDPSPSTFNLTSTGDWDIYISKLDSLGNFVWVKQMGGIYNDAAYSIAIDPASGDIYTTGSFEGPSDFDPSAVTYSLNSVGSEDVFISKLNNLGNFIWAKSIGSIYNDIGNSIVVDPSGNVYTTGHFWSTADFDPGIGAYNLTSAGSWDVFISKLNNSGIFLWAEAMGETSADEGHCLAVDVSGNAHITGYFQSSTISFGTNTLINNGSGDLFIAKIDYTTGIGSPDSKNNFTIFPNPATSQIIISLDESELKNYEISLINILGEVQKIKNDTPTISISSLADGIYFILLTSKNGQKHLSQKFIKE